MCIQNDHTSQHRYRCRPMCATTSAHTLNHLRTSVPMSADVRLHRCRCAMTSVPTSADVGFSVSPSVCQNIGADVGRCAPPPCPSRVPSALVRQGWSIVVNVTPPVPVPGSVRTSLPTSADAHILPHGRPSHDIGADVCRCASTSMPMCHDIGTDIGRCWL